VPGYDRAVPPGQNHSYDPVAFHPESAGANVDVLMSEVNGVDKEKKLVQLPQGALPFDYLVLATGVQYNYFGRDEWKVTG
jgi:NADH dehydrogenase FAD-containing subunit